MEDASPNLNDTATVSLVFTPTIFLEGGPMGGPGEKVSWSCTYHRGRGALDFELVSANKPYYGPGYGPYTFASLSAKAPDTATMAGNASLRLSLEIRSQKGADIRGGYSPVSYTHLTLPTKRIV